MNGVEAMDHKSGRRLNTGGHFGIILYDMHETDDLRVLDYNGQRAFDLFRLDEQGSPILYES